ncbi:hypothetical protein LINGRAHAP2_LOCUS21198 [Linum grandiflorum]
MEKKRLKRRKQKEKREGSGAMLVKEGRRRSWHFKTGEVDRYRATGSRFSSTPKPSHD